MYKFTEFIINVAQEDLNSSADDDAADFRTCRAQLEVSGNIFIVSHG